MTNKKFILKKPGRLISTYIWVAEYIKLGIIDKGFVSPNKQNLQKLLETEFGPDATTMYAPICISIERFTKDSW